MPDTGFKSFFGADTSGSKVRFDPGVRFAINAGYQATDWLSVEAETGFMANRIDSIGGAYIDDASLANVPFLINARFQLPNRSRITPFFGGGLGGAASVIDADHIIYRGIEMQGSQSAAVFAYQAFGGLCFSLNDNMGVSVEYHYFATTGATWNSDITFGTSSDHMGFSGVETHAVSAAFTYRF